MTTDTMPFERFSDLLDTLGSALETWPEPERDSAQRLIAQSPEAQQLLAEAQAVDAAMTGVQPKAPEGLVDRIMRASGAQSPKPKPPRD